MTVALCSSCQDNGGLPMATTVATDSIGAGINEPTSNVRISADFSPVFSIAEWMNETLDGTYTGDCQDGQKMLQYYVDKTKELFDDERASFGEDAPEEITGMEYTKEIDFKKAYETDQFITYTVTTDCYMGGAHGSYAIEGQTFRKQDGRRIGWEVLKADPEGGFQHLLRDGLKEYFEVSSDDELQECFLNEEDSYYIPLPMCPPLFTEDGVLVQYQQYEIAAYAYGLPGFTIPYNRILPCLNVTGQRLINP